MNTNQFTQKTMEALQRAQQIAVEYQHMQVDEEHMLLSLTEDAKALIPQLLTRCGISVDAFRAALNDALSRIPRVSGPGREADKVYISPDFEKALLEAENRAKQMKDEYLSVEHVFLGIASKPNAHVKEILTRMGYDEKKFLKELSGVRGATRVTTDNPEETYDALKKYGSDLVEMARQHKLDTVIGRDSEIRNVIRILSRKTKNNPVLIGEPGVGKTAIAEGLAQRIVRGELHCIGATTLNEYRQYIEKDAALERRFQPVMVGEPSVEDTIAILRGLKERYEVFHGVKIQDNALIAAATLSNRYITDRFLPDKAIDLVDEACAMIRTEIDSMPTEMDDINRHIMQLEIEEAALKKDDDELTKARLAEVQKELAEQRDEFNQMKAKWESEKNAITKVNKLREEIERVNAEMERAERQYDLNKAAELKYGELPKLKKELAAEEAIAEKSKGEDSLLRDKVTEEEIARIVGRWTGIPVAKLMEGEREKLLHLEDTLHQRVIGQDEAVKRVSEAILRSRAGIQDPNRPLGSFLFLGPTGVGKTELAKALAQALFDDEKNMVRIDMSEYMEKFSVSRLIGAPPGYVGYDEGGQLTEAVRRHPYSVVLFDEVEKAHPDVFNVLLQVLDDGRITDSQGRTVDFKNTILIMTSNLGSEYILNGIANDDITPEARAQVDALLKTHFRPEFLNRIDEIVYYKPLTKEQISKIVLLMLGSLNKRLADRQLKVELTDAAMNAVIDQGFDPVYGARPLKRFIQSKIETLVAKHIIAADVKPGDTLTIDVNENGELYMRW